MDEVFLAISKKQCRPKVNGFKIKITEQRFVGSEFFWGLNSFNASNGFTLTSCNCPEFQEEDNRMYVRGISQEKDNREVLVPPQILPMLELAIAEYNEAINDLSKKVLNKPRQRLLSFAATLYILIELEARGYNSFQFRAYTKMFEKVFAKMLFDYTVFVCMGEARHARRQTWQARSFPELTIKGRDAGSQATRSIVYSKTAEFDPRTALDVMAESFGAVRWRDNSFGGPKWATLAETGLKYEIVSDRVFIDNIIHLQHNSGTIFNKPIFFKDELKYEHHYDKNDRCVRVIDAYLEEKGKAKSNPIKIAIDLDIPVSPECWDFVSDALAKGLVEGAYGLAVNPLDLSHKIEYGNKQLKVIKRAIKCEDTKPSGNIVTEYIPGCDCPVCTKIAAEKMAEKASIAISPLDALATPGAIYVGSSITMKPVTMSFGLINKEVTNV